MISQNARQASTLTKKKDAPSKLAFYLALFKAIGGLCIFVVGFTVVILANEIFLRLRLTEANTGVVTYRSLSARDEGRVYVTHYVNDERYTGRLRGIARGGSDARRGAQIRIFYNRADPRQIRTNVMSIHTIIIIVVCVIFAPIFLATEISRIKKEWEEWKEWG